MDDSSAHSAVVQSLIFDLLEWLDRQERSYEEALEAWRTSCPRLPVWEEANDLRLIARVFDSEGWVAKLTVQGRALLRLRVSSITQHG